MSLQTILLSIRFMLRPWAKYFQAALILPNAL